MSEQNLKKNQRGVMKTLFLLFEHNLYHASFWELLVLKNLLFL